MHEHQNALMAIKKLLINHSLGYEIKLSSSFVELIFSWKNFLHGN